MKYLNVPNVEWTRRVDGQETSHSAQVTEVGIVIVDACNYHFCSTFVQTVHEVVLRMVPVLQNYRGMGLTILYALPGGLADEYYNEHTQYQTVEKINYPTEASRRIDNYIQRLELPKYPWYYRNNNHCVCTKLPLCLPHEVRVSSKHLHPAMQIGARDLIIQDHYELYTYCKNYGVKYLFYMGFAADQCILKRPYGMIQMTELGFTCALIRDLVAHHLFELEHTKEESTEKIAHYIEQNIGPTLLSHQIQLQGEET